MRMPSDSKENSVAAAAVSALVDDHRESVALFLKQGIYYLLVVVQLFAFIATYCAAPPNCATL